MPYDSRHTRKPGSPRILLSALAALVAAPAAHPVQIDISGPTGSVSFGRSITALPNGNFVVVDPDGPVSAVGAVYLYAPNGTLISTLTGSSANDHVGSQGIVVLPSGNFLVLSPSWHNGANAGAGAVTFVNGSTGKNGAVTPVNSLVGTSANDQVGANGGSPAIVVLKNGNFLVVATFWDNGAAANAGAVAWGSGTTGVVGAISAANALVGSSSIDFVGQRVVALANGNYVVGQPGWDNGATTNVGAATWGNGTTGTSGAVSATNSLVGTTSGDGVGNRLVALTNGNYVVGSGGWDNAGTADVGAATWANGSSGLVGTVGIGNSVIGASGGDRVGDNILALTNGNYVLNSNLWNAPGVNDVGAVTWLSGSAPTAATVSAANSLIGSTASDQVGFLVVALANGNYVVGSQFWDSGGIVNAGAATLGNGTSGLVGVVSSTNSLVGTSSNDGVGANLLVLTNGNYVVDTFSWDNGGSADAGAVTFGDGSTGVTGVVSAANSLVGLSAGDQVGGAGIVPLTNGSYVVKSPSWDNGVTLDVGAATWGNGSSGSSGIVSPANSLIGSSAGDGVGGTVVALRNGNYVVATQSWRNGASTSAGAVTLGNGSTGTSGTVSISNSLVGSSISDSVGTDVVPLPNGDVVVASPNWNNGAIADVGALTLVSGTSGLSGAVSPSNSFIGATAGDAIGFGANRAFGDGYFASVAPNYDNGATVNVSATTLFDGSQPTTGSPAPANSVIGTVANSNTAINFDYDVSRHRLIVGRPSANVVSLLTIGNGLFMDGFE